ncbi:hypothetical protein QYF36_002136 [Acer negundo]|nr:hypothetical protein QYF36_002136 [Acer negundo]
MRLSPTRISDRPRAKSNLRHRPRLLTRIITLLDLSYPSTKPDFPLKKYSIPVRALRISLPLYNTIFLLVLLSQANPTSGMGWLMRLSLTSKSKSSHEIGEVYEKEWRIRREPSELIRFGLLWKIYDLVAEKGVAWSPPCLQEHLPGFRGWLLGGVSCMDFLVEPDGLTRLERNHRI